MNFVKKYDAAPTKFNIHDIHPIVGDAISIRVVGVDTPGIHTKKATIERKRDESN